MFDFGIVSVEACYHADSGDYYWIVFKDPVPYENGQDYGLCTEWLLDEEESEPIKYIQIGRDSDEHLG